MTAYDTVVVRSEALGDVTVGTPAAENSREGFIEVSSLTTVEQMVACGGLAVRSPLLMQIYADVLELPLAIAASEQTCALGAAIFGAVAAGAFDDVAAAQQRLCRTREQIYRPMPAQAAIYRELLTLYRQLHDGFGDPTWHDTLAGVMKTLIAIRERQRGG